MKKNTIKKVLITGATGQTASYLCEYILKNHPEYEIHCTRRWRSREENIGNFKDKVVWHSCELRDFFNVQHLMNKLKPEKVFVYSASSYVRDSWFAPYAYMDENINHLLNIMNSVLVMNDVDINQRCNVKLKYNPKIFIALSSEEYGYVEHGTKIEENHPLQPVSPYGVSKCACDLMAYQYYKSYGMNVLRIRTFNHESSRRGEVFVTGNFVKQVVEMEKGLREPVLHVGNTSSVRDWTDARDVVMAAWLSTELCTPGDVYNVCSGRAYTIDEFIERMREIAKIDFKIKEDEDRIRPSDVTWLLGNPSKFIMATKWNRKYDFMQDTVPEMFKIWRNKFK